MRVANISGIPIIINNWWWLLPWYLFVVARDRAILILAVWLLAIVSHELGHALAARRLGYDTQSITLYLIGGLARIFIPKGIAPKEMIKIAGAGPLVSILLAVVSAIGFYVLEGDLSNLSDLSDLSVLQFFCAFSFAFNLIVFVFNMLPVWNLDGAQIGLSISQIIHSNDHLAEVRWRCFSMILTVPIVIGLWMIGFYFAAVGTLLMGAMNLRDILELRSRVANSAELR